MIQVKSRLDNELWVKNLFHKDENLFIGKIFERWWTRPPRSSRRPRLLAKAKQLPVPDRRQQDPATSTVTFAKTTGGAGPGHPAPRPYVRNAGGRSSRSLFCPPA